MNNMSVEDANNQLVNNKNFKIIDVREIWEYEIAKINNCIELPLSRIVSDYLILEKSVNYYPAMIPTYLLNGRPFFC